MEKYERHNHPRRSGHRGALIAFLILGLALLTWLIQSSLKPGRVELLTSAPLPDWVEEALIPVDGDSRRGVELEDIRDIVIHYVGNPGTTAAQNRSYYCSPQSEVSSHFLIGLEGEVLLCVPLNEKSSASNNRNKDTISIEVCHPDDSGQFTAQSYEALVKLTAWLLENTGLKADHIIRHYDITGKDCPRYFVHHEDAWNQFRADVKERMAA